MGPSVRGLYLDAAAGPFQSNQAVRTTTHARLDVSGDNEPSLLDQLTSPCLVGFATELLLVNAPLHCLVNEVVRRLPGQALADQIHQVVLTGLRRLAVLEAGQHSLEPAGSDAADTGGEPFVGALFNEHCGFLF